MSIKKTTANEKKNAPYQPDLNLSVKKLLSEKHQQSNKKIEASEIVIPLNQTKNKQVLQFLKRRLKTLSPAPMPFNLKPMLAGTVDTPFNNDEWQFEIKWDGYRAISYLSNDTADIRSRNNLSFNQKYSEVYNALKTWKINAVVDGEIVVLNEEGHADFEALQQWIQNREGTLVYFVFDLLWLEGYDLIVRPLIERRELLKQIMPPSNIIRYSDAIEECGIDFFKVAKQNSLEGIIAKKKDSLYLPAYRTRSWLKIKIEERHEAVICGYTKNKNSDRLFSSLVLGIPAQDKMLFIGQVGTGFNVASQKEIFKTIKPLVINECPFDNIPNTGVPTVWVAPRLVCEVKYTELTKEGIMRHPSFQGMREDKSAEELNKDEINFKKSKLPKAAPEKLFTPIENSPIHSSIVQHNLVDFSNEQQVAVVDKQHLKFSNLKKIYWPKEKICKGDLINYYHLMAPYIMPYMKDRPQSLNRFPNGINGESFYQKNMLGKVEPWIKLHRRFSESNGESKDFMVCTNEASLLYMANLGCIEMNPWHSRSKLPNHPDWSVIDLDPGDYIGFDKVVQTALVVKSILDNYKITSLVKTSGSTGLHIYVPFGARYDYDHSKQFAELIANIVHEELPDITSIERNPQKRKDKIYIDYLQNRPIQTICAPYSVRPKPGATVSAPLHWDEVNKNLKIAQFTIHNIYERVQSEGDLFIGVLGKGIDLNKIIRQLSALV
jgi:bifunctional non-homologous end joining protein LigD